jgi:hypothetical protein
MQTAFPFWAGDDAPEWPALASDAEEIALSQWGKPWSCEYDEIDITWLTISRLRRLQYESRVQAVATVNALNESMGAGGEEKKISTEAGLAMMGG